MAAVAMPQHISIHQEPTMTESQRQDQEMETQGQQQEYHHHQQQPLQETPMQMETISESRPLEHDDSAALAQPAVHHQQQLLEQTSPLSHQASSFSSSSHHYSSELPESILEEGAESGSESPIEPVTPISGRPSQDFTTLQNHADQQPHQQSHDDQPLAYTLPGSDRNSQSILTQAQPLGKPRPAPINTTRPLSEVPSSAASLHTPKPRQRSEAGLPPAHNIPHPEQQPPPLSRRSTRGSTSSFKRTMSNLFRRSNSSQQYYKDHSNPFQDAENGSTTTGPGFKEPSTNNSGSPGSPGSPLEMAQSARPIRSPLPGPEDFKKKNRASTGLALRSIKFAGSNKPNEPRPPKLTLRRASSFESSHSKNPPKEKQDLDHMPWALIPDAGTGAKSRRLSLSLPDDFTVDVAELFSEFEYQSKFLGRHGKGLGKGAGGKVNLMLRKGFAGELYAAKQFRNKSRKETQEEYDQKIKSEFSIAKSLHHPNIIETIRLCTDHGRYTHVMEYCAGGDLYALLKERPLTSDSFQTDRLCIFKQIVQGVAYLHEHGVAHRDLKLENILMTQDSKVKITDFGVSEVFSGTHPGLRESGGQCGKNMGDLRLCSPGICGSEPSIPPEIIAKKDKYDPRGSDVWGTGIIMVCLIFGGYLWNRAERGGQNPMYDTHCAAYEKWLRRHPETGGVISESSYPRSLPFDKKCNPPALKRILLQMLNPDPEKRVTIHEVLHNRFVKNIECCQLPNYDDPALLIDATKKNASFGNKIFCHSHLPSRAKGSHSLGKMPGTAGY